MRDMILSILVTYSAGIGKSLAFAFYMEFERRLGKTRFGSVLGFLGQILFKTPPIEGKEEPK